MTITKLMILAAAGALLGAPSARAHCDGVDGPVARAARTALETADVRPALAWVAAADEKEVRASFARAVAVRRAGGEAKALAETYFMEAVVRLHRAGEGAPYTGLKPAGRDLGPAIPAADAAIESGSAERLSGLLREATQRGLQERFEAVRRAAKFDGVDVDAGRAYVKAYVEFLHYAERIYEAAAPAETPGRHEH
jgi:hypothetical protein